MPKATFSKIAPEKQQRVLRQAARLFAKRGYAATDMAELAERCGVAKGSIYNYFESKEDLYYYVCLDGLERSRRAVYGEGEPTRDIYQLVQQIFERGMAFAEDHPEYVALYLGVAAGPAGPLADEISLQVEQFTAELLKRTIRQGMAEGIVRRDLDVNLAAFLINSLYIIFVSSLVSRHFKLRMKQYLEIEGRVTAAAAREQVRRTIDMIGDILRPRAPRNKGRKTWQASPAARSSPAC